VTVRSRTVGVDLGTRDDYTAIVVLDELEVHDTDEQPTFVVSWLTRRRGVPYTGIIDEIAAMSEWPALRGQPFVVDGTGLGRPVVDALRERVSNVHAVVLTGGEQVVVEHAFESHVPKADVVASVQMLLQAGRLHVDSRLTHAAALRGELLDFGYSISETGRTRLEASSGHDDLVVATGLACWFATRRDSFADALALLRMQARPRLPAQTVEVPETVTPEAALHAARTAAFRARGGDSRIF
jgi:hypothetical protein